MDYYGEEMMNSLLPIADALLSCLHHVGGHTEPVMGFSDIPAVDDEFNGLRDAQQGDICLDGQSSEYYQGYSYGYQEGEY